jgi:hypothetical protein
MPQKIKQLPPQRDCFLKAEKLVQNCYVSGTFLCLRNLLCPESPEKVYQNCTVSVPVFIAKTTFLLD